jgi:hypothetical protein
MQKITSKVLMSSDGEDDVIIRYFTKCNKIDNSVLIIADDVLGC